MVEIAPCYSPSDHSANIFKYSTSRDWSILDLSVDHPGNISTVKFIERDVTDNRDNVPAQSALDLWPGAQTVNRTEVGFRHSRDCARAMTILDLDCSGPGRS